MKKITLLTSFSADYPFGGGSILKFILPEIVKSIAVHWHFIQKKNLNNELVPQLNNLVLHPLRLYSYYPLIRRFQNMYHAIHVPFLAIYLAIYLKRNDKVWVVLENEMIALVYYLLKLKKIQLHVSVHDDCLVSYEAVGNNESQVASVLRQAQSVDLIGENLMNYYKEKFGISSVVYRRGIDKQNERNIPLSLKERKIIKLLFVGSSHSDTSWVKLFKWLESEAGKYQFELGVFGSHDFITHKISVPENLVVKFNPAIDEVQLRQLARDFDLSVFFWNDFNPNRIKYSVSTKLTTYLQFGLPMIASIGREAEVFNLFEYGVAFNFENPETDFSEWLSRDNFQIKFNSYIEDFFNKEKLNEGLLSLPFFSK